MHEMHGSQTENVHMKALIRVKKPSVLFRSVSSESELEMRSVGEDAVPADLMLLRESPSASKTVKFNYKPRESERERQLSLPQTSSVSHTLMVVCVCVCVMMILYQSELIRPTHTHTHSRERLSSIIVCVRVFYRLLVSRLSLLLESHRTNLQEHRELLIYHLQSCSSASER